MGQQINFLIGVVLQFLECLKAPIFLNNCFDGALSFQERRLIELEEAFEGLDHLEEQLELTLVKACKVIAQWVE